MDLTACFNPPRLCRLGGEGGRSYWVRALTLEGLATLLAWLDDVIPGRSDRDALALFGSDEARDAMDSDGGRCVLTWIALRDCRITYRAAASLALSATPEEWARLLDVLFHRRRTLESKPGREGHDIAEWWAGPSVAKLCETYHATPEAVGRLSLDQYDMLASEGDADRKPGTLDLAEVQAMWESAWKAAGKQPPSDRDDGVPESAIEEAHAAWLAAKAEAEKGATDAPAG